MSLVLVLGLVLQLLAVFLVLKQTGRRWLSYNGALFVVVAFVFHGLSELLNLFFPGRNFYRALIIQSDIESWVLIVSLAMLVFSLIYSLTLRRRSHADRRNNLADGSRRPLAPLPEWWVVALVTAPFYLMAISEDAPTGYWMTGLVQQFLILGVVLVFLSFVLKHKNLLLPVMLVQSASLTLMGSRLSVAVALIMLLSAVVRFRIAVQLRHILAMSLLIAVMSLSISAARAAFGREIFTDNVSVRSTALVSGLSSIDNSDAVTQITDDFVYRIDGNTFSSMIYARLASNSQPAGLRPLWNNVVLAVPNFLNPNKLATEEYMREEESYMIVQYALPLGVDFLPTTLGIIFGYYGTAFLLVAAVGLGYMFASLDLWSQRSPSLFPLLVGIALTYCVIFMEQGLRVYFLTFRGVLVLYILLLLFRAIPNLFRRRRKVSPFSSQPGSLRHS